jgi:hypothetical protein
MRISNREKQGNVKNNKGMRKRKSYIREGRTDKRKKGVEHKTEQSKTKNKREKRKKKKCRLKQTCQLRTKRTLTHSLTQQPSRKQ